MDDPRPGDLANLVCRYLGCVFMGGDKGKKSLPFLQSAVVFPKFSCSLENTGFGAGQLGVKPYLSFPISQGFCEPIPTVEKEVRPAGGGGRGLVQDHRQVWCGDKTQVFGLCAQGSAFSPHFSAPPLEVEAARLGPEALHSGHVTSSGCPSPVAAGDLEGCLASGWLRRGAEGWWWRTRSAHR